MLLLDCEGAELQIIAGIEPKPPSIIVETHPSQDAPSDDVENILFERGYEIRSKAKVNEQKHILVGSLPDR